MLDDFTNTEDIELKNKLRLTCIKNTFGPKLREEIWYLKEYSYIGDSTLDLIKVPKKEEKVKEDKKEKTKKEENFEFEDI